MINIENELTVLDINKSEFINKLERLGATKVTDELLQQRYVYDFSPKKELSHYHSEPAQVMIPSEVGAFICCRLQFSGSKNFESNFAVPVRCSITV